MKNKLSITMLGIITLLLTGGCGQLNNVSILANGTATLNLTDYGFDFSEGKAIWQQTDNIDLLLIPVTDLIGDRVIQTAVGMSVNNINGCRIRDLGIISLEAVTSVPTSGYSTTEIFVISAANHSYAVKTCEGNYAKICVSAVSSSEGTVSFAWSYQADGSGRF